MQALRMIAFVCVHILIENIIIAISFEAFLLHTNRRITTTITKWIVLMYQLKLNKQITHFVEEQEVIL